MFRCFIDGSLSFDSFNDHLTPSTKPFPYRSIPQYYYLSTIRWFEGCSFQPPSEGRPPSRKQHARFRASGRTVYPSFSLSFPRPDPKGKSTLNLGCGLGFPLGIEGARWQKIPNKRNFGIHPFYNININDNCNQNLVFRFEGFAYSHQLSS